MKRSRPILFEKTKTITLFVTRPKKTNPLRAHIFHFVFYGRAAVLIQSGEACNLSGFHSNSIVGEPLLKKRAVACAGRG